MICVLGLSRKTEPVGFVCMYVYKNNWNFGSHYYGRQEVS